MKIGELYPVEPTEHEQDPVALAVEALKQNTGSLLERLAEEVDADADSGSDYLSLYLSSEDSSTGLSTGLLVVTDRTFHEDGQPAAFRRQKSGGLDYYYGKDTISLVLVRELSENNFNVQELAWSSQTGPIQPRLTETGLANTSVRSIVGGHRDWLARAQQAQRFGVRPEDLLLYDGAAHEDRVDNFFEEVLTDEVLNDLQPIKR